MSKNIESKSIDQLLAEADELTRQMDSDEVFGMNVEHRLQFNIHTKNLEKIKFQIQSKKEKAISSEPDGMHAAILNIVKAIHGLKKDLSES